MIARFGEAAPEHPAVEYENTFVNRRGERRVVFWRSAPLPDEHGRTTRDHRRRHRHHRAPRGGRGARARTRLPQRDRERGAEPPLPDRRGRCPGRHGRRTRPSSGRSRSSRDETRRHRFLGALHRPGGGRGGQEPDRSRRRRRDGRRPRQHLGGEERAALAVSWSCIRLPSIDERRLLLVSGVDVTRAQAARGAAPARARHHEHADAGDPQHRRGRRPRGRSSSTAASTRTVRGSTRRSGTALGWPDEQLVRTSVLELIDPADGYFARMAIASAANGVASVERESLWRKADGDRIAIAWTATPVADVTLREASLVLLSGIDVTERKRQDEEIRASRARIIEAADNARRVLERNLHDGAQQRLVALSVTLRLAEARTATDPAEAAAIISAAREELAAALEDLRELARGIHPAVLTDRGLAAAVEALVARTPLPVTVTMPAERLPAPIEAAAYYVVSEALTNIVKYAGATAIEVAVDGRRRVRHRCRHRRRLRRRRSRSRDGPAWPARPHRSARRDAHRREPGRSRHEDRGRDPARSAARAAALTPLDSVAMSAEAGTVAFLLCDVEGSTASRPRGGRPTTPTILNGVRRILRDAVASNRGTVVDAYGDEVFAAFDSLDDAVGRSRRGPAGPDRGAVARRARRPGPDGHPRRAAAPHRRRLHGHRRPPRGTDRVGGPRRADPPLGRRLRAGRRSASATSGATGSPACRSRSTSTSCSPTASRATSRRCATRSPCSGTR